MTKSGAHISVYNTLMRRTGFLILNRKRNLIFVAILVSVFVLFCFGCTRGEVTDARFYYLEICPGCESYKTAERIATRLHGAARRNRLFEAQATNMLDASALPELVSELERRGLPDISRSVPILLIDDRYHIGYEDIEKAIAEIEVE